MNHPFTPSLSKPEECGKCSYSEVDHTSRATCEACGNTGTCELWHNYNGTKTLLCPDCFDKEKEVFNSPEAQEARVKASRENFDRTIAVAKEIDSSIQVRTDFFNAETVAIADIFKAVEENPEIINKPFEKARLIKERFDHFQSVIFDARSTLEQATNSQRAIQTQLNELANKLRAEEREKLKLQDISYKPEPPKTVKTRTTKPTKKWTKASVREMAATYQVPVDAVQMICVARNVDAETAAKILHEQLK